MPGLWTQLKDFILISLLGVALAVVFHLYQRILVNAKTKGIVIRISDLLIWMILIVVVFAALLVINHGDLRFYVILGLIAGGLFYASYLIRKTNRFVDKVALGVAVMVKSVIRIISKPITTIIDKRRRPPTDLDDGPG